MEVSVEHLADTQFGIKEREHTIVCDQPPQDGGYDEGITPPELLFGITWFLRRFLCSHVSQEAQARKRRHPRSRYRRKG